jgi:glycosyltransferase involved in cell wall biosynthesis
MTARRRLLVLCPFPVGVAAGQRLKYEQYFDDWRRSGFDIDVAPFADLRLWAILYQPGKVPAKAAGVLRGHLRRLRDVLRVRRYDLVYVHMNVTPLGTTLFERLTRALARRLVFDLEDNVIGGHAEAKRNPNPIVRFLKGSGKARFLVRTADHVVTSSPQLNDRCLELNHRRACTYISSSVDTDRFVPAPPRAREKVTIGWTGTFSTSNYLDLLRPVFLALARRIDFRLKVIGNFDWALDGVDLEVVRWTAEREVADLQDLDIGVYPLTDDDWVIGKSGLKAIQYMAFGIPTVATAAGTTPRIIRDGENGLLVRTEEEWVDALERLARDAQLRRRLGDQARQDAIANYSIKAVAADYRRVLADALGTKDL